jgi:hypothetical protein
MTEVSIVDFQGVSAKFALGHPLTMISGANGAGKSRIARALAAVLSDTTTPITGKKGDLRECLTTGGPDRASVVLRADGSLKAMIWTDGRCEPSVKGPQDALPRASKYAAGLVSLLTLTGKDRAAGFADVFKTEPTKAEFERAWKASELPRDRDRFEALWQAIDVNGWDAVTKDAQDQARKLKGAWGEVTGAAWGERVAENWEPPDAAGIGSVADLEAALERAREDLEDAKRAVTVAEAERAKLPARVEDAGGHTCPWCEKPVMLKFGKLEKIEQPKMSSKEIAELRQAIAGADGIVANRRDQVFHHERAVGAAEARIKDATQAREKAKARADELHRQITEQLEIARICGPAGLRKTKLEEVLVVVNQSLTALAQATGLPLLEISADLEATIAGTAYHRLSRAESWMARAIMQIVVAQCDGSTIVVIDDLDVLISPKDRNAVMNAICQSSLQAVILQAAWDPADAHRTPDLAAAGYGVSLWIDHTDGLRPLADARAGATREAA